MFWLLLWKSERRITATQFSVITTKCFFFSKMINIKHVWLLHRKPMLHSRSRKIAGGLQSNRVNREPTLADIIRSNKKCIQCVGYFYGNMKEERITATQFSVRKTKCFFFSKRINIKHVQLLHRKPMLHSRNPKINGGLQNNRVNCWL